jgi:hypothetical protein
VWRGETVWAHRRHRVERVRNRDNPRTERDRLTDQPRRVAGPVKTLVVVAHDPGEPGVSEARNDLSALVGMSLCDLKLSRRQLVGLVEDLRRDSELAHIVERSGGLDPRDLLVGQTHLARDHRGVTGHTSRMTIGIWILRIERGGQLRNQVCPLIERCAVVEKALLATLEVEHLDSVRELSVDAEASQPTPNQDLAEEQIAGSTAPLPVGTPDPRDHKREDHRQHNAHPRR